MILHDTICALATPPGIGGLAVVRLSGSSSLRIADACFSGKRSWEQVKSHTIHYGHFVRSDHRSYVLDTVTASVFRAPHSYTGEDTVEFGCHGGMILASDIVSSLISAGARMALPGEFTKRAFLNRKLDLTQAEAVADMIHAVSTRGAQTATRQLLGGLTKRLQDLRLQLMDICGLLELELDFADEGIELIDRAVIRDRIHTTQTYCAELAQNFRASEIVRSGYTVGIIGYPNAGKSSLLNTLLQRTRAIVSDVPGTTRDYIEEMTMMEDMPIVCIDTAGIRASEDMIEIEGIKLAESLIQRCHAVVVLNDCLEGVQHSQPLYDRIREQYPHVQMIAVQNKIDALSHDEQKQLKAEHSEEMLFLSTKNNEGVAQLQARIAGLARADSSRVSDSLINQRHAQLLHQIVSALQKADNALDTAPSNEFIAIDVREALRLIGEMTGEVWNEDILNHIFSRFCIGK